MTKPKYIKLQLPLLLRVLRGRFAAEGMGSWALSASGVPSIDSEKTGAITAPTFDDGKPNNWYEMVPQSETEVFKETNLPS